MVFCCTWNALDHRGRGEAKYIYIMVCTISSPFCISWVHTPSACAWARRVPKLATVLTTTKNTITVSITEVCLTTEVEKKIKMLNSSNKVLPETAI